ncbi:hypothetical protein PHMEG_00017969 [Phytophthora megakarya]|uniref:Uncharacterized protein n=1 Tax=Phytophthora megakarya TaxID=4795 RepID=A0A225VX22_9STRA|nr:hypothetical protein PHMEG_00017969 [Phytophthora megakarya]
MALNAEYNFKSAHASWIAPSASRPEDPEPMDHSSADPDHPRPRCPLGKARKAALSQTTDSSQRNADSQLARGRLLGKNSVLLNLMEKVVLSNTDRERMPGLLVVEATTKDFENTWNVLIVSGPSGNYALQAHSRDTVTVRLVTSVRVPEPKVPLDLGVKFLHFDSTERVWYWPLIRGMTSSLERNEPWIDCRSKTLGATHFSPGGDLASHESTSVRIIGTPHWREGCTEWAALLDVGVAEIVTDVVEDHRPVASETLSSSDEVSNVPSDTDARNCNEHLYTLVNGVTGEVSLDTLQFCNALLELDEMSMTDFGDAFKADNVAEMVMIRPERQRAVGSKKALNARSQSEILNDRSDPFHSLLAEYDDVVSKTPPMGNLWIEGSVTKLTWFQEHNTA